MKFRPEIRHLILVAALVSTVYAEHRLAVWAGWNPWIAYVLPGIADLYLIKATKDREDITYAILVVVALVSTSYAVTMPWDPVKTIISILVADLAPIVLWRLHITHDHKMGVLYGTETAQAVHRARDNGWAYEFADPSKLGALRDAESLPEPSHGERCDGNCGMTPDECRVCETLPEPPKDETEPPAKKPRAKLTPEQESIIEYGFMNNESAEKVAKAAGCAPASVYRRYDKFKQERAAKAEAEETRAHGPYVTV